MCSLIVTRTKRLATPREKVDIRLLWAGRQAAGLRPVEYLQGGVIPDCVPSSSRYALDLSSLAASDVYNVTTAFKVLSRPPTLRDSGPDLYKAGSMKVKRSARLRRPIE